MNSITCASANHHIHPNGFRDQVMLYNPPLGPVEPYQLNSEAYQDRLSLQSSGARPEPTTSSVPGRLDGQGKQMSPFSHTFTSPNQARYSQQQYFENQWMAATPHWSGAHPSPKAHDGVHVPIADMNEETTTIGMEDGLGIKGKDNTPLKSPWTDIFGASNGKDPPTISSSHQQHISTEQRSRLCKWPCPFCNQHFKRKDYIKPHVRRKHPELSDRPYAISSSTQAQTQSMMEPSPSTQYGFMLDRLPTHEQALLTMPFGSSELDYQFPNPLQHDILVSKNDHESSKRPLHTAFPDGAEISDQSANRFFKCLKTSHGTQERSLGKEHSLPLACPFAKNNPLRHRKCLGLTLLRPKDVKQHIYRSHMKPEYYCAICYDIFHTGIERDMHSRKRTCEKRDEPELPQFRGITDDQRTALKERLPRDLNVEAQWFQIYDIVFPNSEQPKSAYVGNYLEDIMPFLREQWHTRVHAIVEHAQGRLPLNHLKSAIDSIFEN